VTRRLPVWPPQTGSIFSAGGSQKMKYEITLGPNASGRDKETNQRHYCTRLSTGDRLQVVDGKPVTISLSAIDLTALQVAEGRGFVSLAESSSKRGRPSLVATGSDKGGDE